MASQHFHECNASVIFGADRDDGDITGGDCITNLLDFARIGEAFPDPSYELDDPVDCATHAGCDEESDETPGFF